MFTNHFHVDVNVQVSVVMQPRLRSLKQEVSSDFGQIAELQEMWRSASNHPASQHVLHNVAERARAVQFRAELQFDLRCLNEPIC